MIVHKIRELSTPIPIARERHKFREVEWSTHAPLDQPCVFGYIHHPAQPRFDGVVGGVRTANAEMEHRPITGGFHRHHSLTIWRNQWLTIHPLRTHTGCEKWAPFTDESHTPAAAT